MADLQNPSRDFLSTGYNRFRTPFFKIFIAPYNKPANPIELPAELYKLVQKVEIVETQQSASCIFHQFSITFIEGSREPYEQVNSTSAAGIYKSDVTNAPGMITDLHFNKYDNTISAINPFSLSQISNVSKEGVVYLFQEGNVVTIEWGYVEDPNNIRITQSDFPEYGHPTTTISCQSPMALLDQVTTPFGRNYKIPVGGGVNEAGTFVPDYADISTIALLTKFSAKHGFDLIISSSILNDTLDKNASKVWSAGVSFSEFIKKLAKMSNCIFKVYVNPNNNYRYTIEFINHIDYLTKSSIPAEDDNLLTYKAPNSILKSFSVRADFAGLPNTASVGISASGATRGAVSYDGGSQTSRTGTTRLINSKPGDKHPVVASLDTDEINTADSDLQSSATKVKINPMTETPSVFNETALADFGRCGNKQIVVEFSTLGYPLIFAGQTVNFKNVGVRYSAFYTVQMVTHTIDSTGYSLRGTAFGSNLGGSIGIIPASAKSVEERPKKLDVQLMQGLNSKVDPVAKTRKNNFKTKK